MGEGSVQSARVHMLVKAFVDQESDIKNVHSPGSQSTSRTSDFIWPFLGPYMGVIPNPKMAFIFPISYILALVFPILIKYFPKCEEKGSFLKSQIKSLWTYRSLIEQSNFNWI